MKSDMDLITSKQQWPLVRFDEMAQNITERAEPSEADTEYYVGLEHLDPESLKIRRWGSPDQVEATKLRFQPGDIIFGKRRAYQRKLAVAEFEGICSAHAMVLRARPEVALPEFLPFLMQSDMFFDRALSISVGSLSPTINWKALARQEFPLPPIAEQRRIAEILWAADAAVEGHLASHSELLAFRKALWQEVLSSAWPIVALGHVTDISNGTTPSRKEPRYWDNGDIAWLPTGKVHDRIISSADAFVTQKALEETSLKLLPVGTILVAMIGEGKTRGNAAYLTIEACINQNFASIIAKPAAESWYLFHCLDNSYEELRRFSQGSSQGALNCRVLQKFPIPLPPLSMQREIASAFRALDEQMSSIEAHIQKILDLKQTLLKTLLLEA